MENILWDDVVFKLRKTRQKLALSLTPLGAVRAAAEGTGYKNRSLGKSRGVRFDSRLVQSVRCDTLWAWNGCSVFLLALLNVSGKTLLSLFCMYRSGCSYCDASGEFCLPSLRVLGDLLRVSIKKKKSQCRRTTAWQFIRIQANVLQPFQVPLDSAFDRLKMNSSQPSARYHSRWRSWRLHVDWLAQTTLYQVSQAQTAGWVKKKQKRSEACSCTSWCSQATF